MLWPSYELWPHVCVTGSAVCDFGLVRTHTPFRPTQGSETLAVEAASASRAVRKRLVTTVERAVQPPILARDSTPNTKGKQAMILQSRARSWGLVTASVATSLTLGVALFSALSSDAQAGNWRSWFKHRCDSCAEGNGNGIEVGGSWYWLRSPDEEHRVAASIYNRYCIRCHGIDGRGVWDIPGVPDFTNAHWQASRAEGEFARRILEGRGAVMPPFRGTLSLDEAWAMERYVRKLVPGTEISPPDFSPPKKLESPKK